MVAGDQGDGRPQMKTWIGALVLLALAGCGPQNISGSYMTHDDRSAALLQLTESQGQQVMGNMILVRLLPNGLTERTEVSITGGTVDANGHTLVLTMKANEFFAQARNVSGEISNRSIDLAMPGGTMRLSSSKPEDFDATIHKLAEAGKQQQQIQEQAKQIADDINRVADLTRTLAAYNTRIQSSIQGPEVARTQEEHLVDAARKALTIMQNLESKQQDFPASQVKYRIGQLAFQMGQIKFQVDQAIRQGREHLAAFDNGLAKNPCNTNANLQGCDALTQEKVRYTTTRAAVENNLAQLSSDLQKNGSDIEAINKQAGN